MSLIKQLWLGIIFLLLLVLVGNFAISAITAKTYLQEQLRLKNIDNASSLALSISQLPEKDPVTLELLITAQFDAGHYEYIIFQDVDKKPIVARNFEEHSSETVPAWFARYVKFEVAPGIAQVQDGWQQAGTLIVKSHSRYALEALWKNTRDLFDWFLFVALLGGLAGSLILKYISRPLDVVVEQAEAIGERRFVVSEEPRTKEFQRLVRAMNTLSTSVKNMLDKEARQLEILRRESQTDALTGLVNRTHFMNLLDVQLTREDAEKRGILVIARVLALQELNIKLGHHQVDQLLRVIASVFFDLQNKFPNSHAARLNGSDFCLLIPTNLSVDLVSLDISQALNFQLITGGFENTAIPLALCTFHRGERASQVMHKLDGALAQAELKGNRAVVAVDEQRDYSQQNLAEWRAGITQALAAENIRLASFPVKDAQGEIIHYETAVRLRLDDQLQAAGYFMPWAVRLGLIADIDLAVLNIAVKQLESQPDNLAVNISAFSLCNTHFREQAIALLSKYAGEMKRLWIEFPEVCMLRHLEELRAFTVRLRALGCKVGLEHAGLEFTQFGKLQDMGLHYLKIDAAITRSIDENLSGQSFVQSLCTLAHSLGIYIIAEGVSTEEEQLTLIRVGMDGLTGTYIQ